MTEPTPDAPQHPVAPPPSVPLTGESVPVTTPPPSAPLPSAPLPSAPLPSAPLPSAPLPSAPLTGESAPVAVVAVAPLALVEVKPRLSAGVWVFSVLLVLLLTGLGVLGVVYTNNKRTAERVQGEQSARITQLTETTDKQTQTIDKTEQQIRDVQAQVQELTAKNAGFEACRKAVQSLYDAGVAQSTPGVQAAMAAMLRDCKEVA